MGSVNNLLKFSDQYRLTVAIGEAMEDKDFKPLTWPEAESKFGKAIGLRVTKSNIENSLSALGVESSALIKRGGPNGGHTPISICFDRISDLERRVSAIEKILS